MAGKLDIDIARKNIRLVRVRMGIKREEFARSIGMSYKTLANFEGGNNPISDEFLFRIAGGLNLTQDDLFDPNLEKRLGAQLAMPKPDTPPAPDAEFEELIEIVAALSPAGQELVVDFAKMLAEKARTKNAK